MDFKFNEGTHGRKAEGVKYTIDISLDDSPDLVVGLIPICIKYLFQHLDELKNVESTAGAIIIKSKRFISISKNLGVCATKDDLLILDSLRRENDRNKIYKVKESVYTVPRAKMYYEIFNRVYDAIIQEIVRVEMQSQVTELFK